MNSFKVKYKGQRSRPLNNLCLGYILFHLLLFGSHIECLLMDKGLWPWNQLSHSKVKVIAELYFFSLEPSLIQTLPAPKYFLSHCKFWSHFAKWLPVRNGCAETLNQYSRSKVRSKQKHKYMPQIVTIFILLYQKVKQFYINYMYIPLRSVKSTLDLYTTTVLYITNPSWMVYMYVTKHWS